jgi:hypothetical protein
LLAAAPATRPQRSHDAAEDVYQPPGETGYEASTAPDLMAASPVESPADIPTAAAPVSTNDSPSATTSPAPLFPIAQP